MKDCAGRVYPWSCHVGRAADIRQLVDTTHREFGRIDILVNNAATNIAQEPVLAGGRSQVRQDDRDQPEERLPLHSGRGSRHVRARLRIDHQHRVHRRPAAAVARHALQHDEGRAHHDDAIVCAGTGTEGRARQRHRARPGADRAQRVLLEGRGQSCARSSKTSRSNISASRTKLPKSRSCWPAIADRI